MSDTSVNGLAPLCSILLALTTATLFLRLIARQKQKASLLMDDWMVVSAWIFFSSLTAICFYGISQKFMGYHEPHDPKIVAEVHPTMEKTYISLDALTVMTLGLVKLSALFFYRRVFCTGPRRDAFSIVSAAAIAVVMSWTVTFFVMTFLVCGSNVNFLWAPGHSAKCHLIYPYFMATTISGFLLDVFIICLPIPKIWSLNMSTKRKIAVSGVFLLALVGLAASTTRMVITIHLVTRGRAINDEDAYQSNTSWAFYIILEAGLTIIAVNLPTLWYYVAGVTPERVLRSVRSIISLGSDRGSQSSVKGSNVSEYQVTKERYTGGRSLDTGSSRTNLTNPDKRSVETYAMPDLEPKLSVQPTEGIRVDRSFQRTEEQV